MVAFAPVISRRFAPALLSLLLIGLTSCATAPPQNVYEKMPFLKGDVLLGCSSASCAWAWRSSRSELNTLSNSMAWEELARRVTNIQYDNELAYFYLGRAAEEMGAAGAAIRYFDRSASASSQCSDGLLGRCNDIPVAAQASKRLREIRSALNADTEMEIAEAQGRLNQLGLYTTTIDGIPGPRTTAAITEFQTNLGLSETGTLTPETLFALSKTSAMPTPALVARNKASQETLTNRLNALEAPEKDQEIVPALVPENAPIDIQEATPTEVMQIAPVSINSATEASVTIGATSTISGERTQVKIEIELLSEADPFAEVVAVLRQGAWVTIIDRGVEWSKISYDDKTGYVYTDNLQ